MPDEDQYCGDEKRVSERRSCPMDVRFVELERDARRLTSEVRHITTCLNGYKGFMEALKKREELKNRIREKLLERGVMVIFLSILGGLGLVLWLGFKEYVRAILK